MSTRLDPCDQFVRWLDGIGKWYWYAFLTNFLTYFPLTLALLVCVGLLTNLVGADYGVDKIVWHDHWLKQFFVGVSLALVLAFVFFVGYLLWLRDQRDGYLRAKFPKTSYGAYLWQMVWCLLISGLVVWATVAVLKGVVYPDAGREAVDQQSILEIDRESRAYTVPLHLLVLALVGGWVFWLIWESNLSQPWMWLVRCCATRLGKFFNEKPAGVAARVSGVVVFLVAWYLLATATSPWLFDLEHKWKGLPTPEQVRQARSAGKVPETPEEQDPHASADFYKPLVWGALATGLVLWFLTYLSGWVYLSNTPIRGFLKSRLGKFGQFAGAPVEGSKKWWLRYLRSLNPEWQAFWRGRLLEVSLDQSGRDRSPQQQWWARMVGWETFRQRLPWVFFLMVLVLWASLLWLASGDTPEQRLGMVLIVLGWMLSVFAFRWPNKFWFMVALVMHLMASVAIFTWWPSSYWSTDPQLIGAYSLTPLALLLLLALLGGYSPGGFQAVFSGRQGRAASTPDEHVNQQVYVNRYVAAFALLGGWVVFVFLAGLHETASPVLMASALIFVLVGLYGFIAYLIRGALAPLAAVLVLFAVLSGVQLYKVRFPGIDDQRYKALVPCDKQRPGPLSLDELLKADLKLIDEQTPELQNLLRAATKYDSENSYLQTTLVRKDDLEKELGPGKEVPAVPKELLEEIKKRRAAVQTAQAALDKAKLAAREPYRLLRAGCKILEPRTLVDLKRVADLLGEPPQGEHLLLTREVNWSAHGKFGGGPALTEEGKRPLILITVSGGALRSAVWTHLIMSQLEKAFEKENRDFPAHVRLITGASGGMLGASYYVTALPPPHERGADRQAVLHDSLKALGEGDSITPLMRQMVFGDVPNFFSPWPSKYDRGLALERAWRDNLKVKGVSCLDTTFAELRPKEAAGWCPSLVLSPMMIEDGRRLIISNLSLFEPLNNQGNLLVYKYKSPAALIAALAKRFVNPEKAPELVKQYSQARIDGHIQEYDYNLLYLPEKIVTPPVLIASTASLLGAPDGRGAFYAASALFPGRTLDLAKAIQDGNPVPDAVRLNRYRNKYSIEGMELFRLFPNSPKEFQTGTAVRMSASFPFFSPAVSLPTWPRRRVVDAGYYDNYGISFSAAWLFSPANADWLRQNVNKVCIIQIRDGVSDKFRRLEKVRPNRSTEVSRTLEELFSPLEGLYNAQESSSSFRNDGQLALLSQFMKEKFVQEQSDTKYKKESIEFNVVTFEYPGRAAMNWHLTDLEFKDLQKNAQGPEVQEQIRNLIYFLFQAPSN